jgi:uncharacterized repeat protein (TIGR03843 family)
MTVHGRIPGSSNATLLVTCTLGGEDLLGVYKPVRGERPLWDYRVGLHRREAAAYILSRTLGWDLVPETVVRDDGPFGTGSVQRLVPEDGTSHYFTLVEDPRWHPDLARIAAFDVISNNSDRKSGHVLLEPGPPDSRADPTVDPPAGGRLWAIDHGLTFHDQPKLRTVIWDFAGTPLDPEVATDLRRFAERGRTSGLPVELTALLEPEEIDALLERVGNLLDAGRLPAPDDDREWPPYPWPLV